MSTEGAEKVTSMECLNTSAKECVYMYTCGSGHVRVGE